MKHYVIVGNGTAAAGCIEGIRSRDPSGTVTVISEERHPVYCRPLISYLLEGKTQLSRMGYRSGDFYERMDCTVLYGRRAVRIHPDEKQVGLDDGTAVPYSELCLAAGSAPFVPPDSRVLIMGAGLIGLKCAEGIAARAGSVTVCDLADRVLSSILDAESAAMMQKHLEAHGIRFFLKDSAVRFGENTAVMRSGAVIPFDLLVLAVGVRPNAALMREIGGGTGRGILVDGQMKTSVEHIFAAGDCTESFDLSSGQQRVMAILPNAYLQGHAAGVNMAERLP